MIKEIFNKWIETGTVSQEDIVPILLEYDLLYNEGKATPEQCMVAAQLMSFNLGECITRALKMIAYKWDGQLQEVYDKNGKLLRRYWYES